ncbi:MAG TPA: hypothetical protein VFH92_13295, partial [Phenylobacterium sp.]|nr:hypothetical protein [Phenylobacterium sp.]
MQPATGKFVQIMGMDAVVTAPGSRARRSDTPLSDEPWRALSLTTAALYVPVLFMSDASAHDDDDELASRDAEILDELAELGLELARGLQERALAAAGAQDASTLAMAFQRVARTVRQSLALKGKLRRDELREGREMHRDASAEIARRIR